MFICLLKHVYFSGKKFNKIYFIYQNINATYIFESEAVSTLVTAVAYIKRGVVIRRDYGSILQCDPFMISCHSFVSHSFPFFISLVYFPTASSVMVGSINIFHIRHKLTHITEVVIPRCVYSFYICGYALAVIGNCGFSTADYPSATK